jgi:hypothetical protein
MHGYSSSSDSEDDYPYTKPKSVAPATTTTNDANKKKKKRKLPPQQTINRIWKRFSNKRFAKALAVLPFDPVLPPTISDRSNELLSAGYERAAEECRRKVRKIIQECRRVNTRYRDPGWDIVRAAHTPPSGFILPRLLTNHARTGTSRWARATASTASAAPSST